MPERDADATARTFTLRWAEARSPLLRAAAALWLPTLLPFVFGPLTECGHCIRTYLTLLPVQPGFLAAASLRNSAWFHVVGGLATALLLAGVATLLGIAGRRWPWVALLVAALAGAQALVLGQLLRM